MSIFREYDIRGIFGEDLNRDVVVKIGAELGREIIARGGKSVGIGYDARKHSPILFKWLCEGLDSANPQNLGENSEKIAESSENNALKIYDLGMIPTPCAYYSLYMKESQVDSSIMITGSHNPPKYNGFKITILKKPFYGEDIRKLGERITQNMGDSHDSNNNAPISSLRDSAQRAESWQSINESTAQNPPIQKLNALQSYVDFLTTHFAKLKDFPHKVAFDCGNGVAGIALKSVLSNLNIPHLPLFFEPNGDFPNHHPDPSEDKNLVFLRNAMKENDIKIGIAFDGDADRIGLLTQNYHFKGDELAILFARQIAKSGAKPPIKPVVIGEVKCSAIMYSEINKFGSTIMHKTGHSNLKVKLAETNAHLAAEMSGHIFFNDRYFGYDDAIYASLRALELFLDSSVENLESFIKSLPQMFSTSEEKIESSEDKKFEIIKKLAKKLNEIRSQQSANQSGGDSQNLPQNPRDSQNLAQDFPKIMDIIDIDGIRVVFENGWGLIRASNTTPVLVTRFEGEERECAELYKTKMLSLLSECEKDLR